MTGESIAGLWAGGMGILILGSVGITLLIGSYYKPKVRQVAGQVPRSAEIEALRAELRHVYAELRRINEDRTRLQERTGVIIDPLPLQEWKGRLKP